MLIWIAYKRNPNLRSGVTMYIGRKGGLFIVTPLPVCSICLYVSKTIPQPNTKKRQGSILNQNTKKHLLGSPYISTTRECFGHFTFLFHQERLWKQPGTRINCTLAISSLFGLDILFVMDACCRYHLIELRTKRLFLEK